MAATKKLVSLLLAVALVASLHPAASPPAAAAMEGDGTASDPYIIKTQAELQSIEEGVAAYYRLGADITIDAEWTPLGKGYDDTGFSGTLDGAGHTVTFTGSGSSFANNYRYNGLFGKIAVGGVVKNLCVDGTLSAANDDDNTYLYLGGIAGENNGTIENCVVTASITATNNATGNPRSYTGGIAGQNNGTIQNCYTTGGVTAITAVTAGSGGIAAINKGTVEYCYTTGNVYATTTTELFNISSGGIVGFADSGTIQHCVALGKSTVGSNRGCVVGSFTSGTNLAYNYSSTTLLIGALADEKNGESVTLSQAVTEAWWWSIWSAFFGSNDSKPWTWATGDYPLPVLYWQETFPATPSHFEGALPSNDVVIFGVQNCTLPFGIAGSATFEVTTFGIADGTPIELVNVNAVQGISMNSVTVQNNRATITINITADTPSSVVGHPLQLCAGSDKTQAFLLYVQRPITIGTYHSVLPVGAAGSTTFIVSTYGIPSGTPIALVNVNNVAGISMDSATVQSSAFAITINITADTPYSLVGHPLRLKIGSYESSTFYLKVGVSAIAQNTWIGPQQGTVYMGEGGSVKFDVTASGVPDGTPIRLVAQDIMITMEPAVIKDGKATITLNITDELPTILYYTKEIGLWAYLEMGNYSTGTFQVYIKPYFTISSQRGPLIAGRAGATTFLVETSDIPDGELTLVNPKNIEGITMTPVTTKDNRAIITINTTEKTPSNITDDRATLGHMLRLEMGEKKSYSFFVHVYRSEEEVETYVGNWTALAPIITRGAVDINCDVGEPVALTVEAYSRDTGTLSYQWYKNTTASTTGGTSLGSANGARTATYTPDTSKQGIYYYYVVVTNSRTINGTQQTATSTSRVTTVRVGEQLSGTLKLTLNKASGAVTASVSGGNVANAGTLTYTWSGGAKGAGTTKTPTLGTMTTCTVTSSKMIGSLTASITVYCVALAPSGKEDGDSAAIAAPYGVQGESVTIAYTVAQSGSRSNRVIFSGGSVTPSTTIKPSGTASYIINKANAVGGIVTLTAAFEHSDLQQIDGTVSLTLDRASGAILATVNTNGTSALKYEWVGDNVASGNTSVLTAGKYTCGSTVTLHVTRAGASGSLSASITVYRVDAALSGDIGGDSVTITPPYGEDGDTVDIAYTLAQSGTERNSVTFSGGTVTPADSILESGTASYTISAADATDGMITLAATFEHTDIPTYHTAFSHNDVTQNGVTAAATLSPSGAQPLGTLVTATVTLSGTAAAAGTHTVGLMSQMVGITEPETVTKTVAADDVLSGSDTFAFTLMASGSDVDDLMVTHSFAPDSQPEPPVEPTPTTYTVTVGGSYAVTSGAGEYEEGVAVTVSAGTRSNHTFNGWTVTSGGVTLADATAATTTFTMPANTVELTANWSQNATPAPTPPPSPPSTPDPEPEPEAKVPEVTINGAVPRMELTEDGVLLVTYSPEDLPQDNDDEDDENDSSDDKTIIVVEGYNNINFDLPLDALGEKTLSISTDFGSITFSPDSLQSIKKRFGNTLKLVIVRGSFKVALLDENGVETPYSDPDNPFSITMPYPLGDGENPLGVVAARGGKVLPRTVYGDGMASFAVPETGLYDLIYNAKEFGDTTDHWAQDDITFASARELMNGIGGELFAPNQSVTRAMFATMLARLEGVDTSAGENWYDAGVEWAAKNGIMSGEIQRDITREEVAVMLYRYLGSPSIDGEPRAFADADSISDWAKDAIAYLSGIGVFNGKATGIFDPQASVTRAEVAAVLRRVLSMR